MSLEEVKLRSITGGALHKRSLVFHIEHQGRYLQYTVNHIYTETINSRLVASLISS